MESMDSKHRVLSAGISPVKEINPLTIQVMKEIGLPMKLADLQPLAELKNEQIDYLITVGEHTKEEFHHLPISYGNKLHLSFNNPDKPSSRYDSQLDAYRHLRDEIRTELDYFYHRILKEKAAN